MTNEVIDFVEYKNKKEKQNIEDKETIIEYSFKYSLPDWSSEESLSEYNISIDEKILSSIYSNLKLEKDRYESTIMLIDYIITGVLWSDNTPEEKLKKIDKLIRPIIDQD